MVIPKSFVNFSGIIIQPYIEYGYLWKVFQKRPLSSKNKGDKIAILACRNNLPFNELDAAKDDYVSEIIK